MSSKRKQGGTEIVDKIFNSFIAKKIQEIDAAPAIKLDSVVNKEELVTSFAGSQNSREESSPINEVCEYSGASTGEIDRKERKHRNPSKKKHKKKHKHTDKEKEQKSKKHKDKSHKRFHSKIEEVNECAAKCLKKNETIFVTEEESADKCSVQESYSKKAESVLPAQGVPLKRNKKCKKSGKANRKTKHKHKVRPRQENHSDDDSIAEINVSGDEPRNVKPKSRWMVCDVDDGYENDSLTINKHDDEDSWMLFDNDEDDKKSDEKLAKIQKIAEKTKILRSESTEKKADANEAFAVPAVWRVTTVVSKSPSRSSPITNVESESKKGMDKASEKPGSSEQKVSVPSTSSTAVVADKKILSFKPKSVLVASLKDKIKTESNESKLVKKQACATKGAFDKAEKEEISQKSQMKIQIKDLKNAVISESSEVSTFQVKDIKQNDSDQSSSESDINIDDLDDTDGEISDSDNDEATVHDVTTSVKTRKKKRKHKHKKKKSKSKDRDRSSTRKSVNVLRSKSRSPRHSKYSRSRSRSRSSSKHHSASYRRSRSRSRSPSPYSHHRKYKDNRRGRSSYTDYHQRPSRGTWERSRSRSSSPKFYAKRHALRDDKQAHSKSPVKDARERIDQVRLLKIAKANLKCLQATGALPAGLKLPDLKPDQMAMIQAGGKTVEELTNVCKKLVNKESGESNSDSAISNSEDEDLKIHHPFNVKDKEPNFVLNIRNARQMPTTTNIQRITDQAGAQLRLQFPVSSGSQHRMKELEWVPVEKDESKVVVKKDTKAPQPTPAEKKPPPAASTDFALMPPPPVPSSSSAPVTNAEVPVTAPVPPPSVVTAAIAAAQQLAAASALRPEDKVFEDQAPVAVDVGSVVAERLAAMRKLQENPNDVEAMSKMYQSQQMMQSWVQSKQLPGQFIGSTGANILSRQELGDDHKTGRQIWAKKDQFQHAAPVSGGMGKFLLQKMGWKEGEGLGKNKSGSLTPLVLDVKMDRKGLVTQEEVSVKGRVGRFPVPPVQYDLSGKHPVSALTELCNKRRWGPPQFTLVDSTGPDHRKHFLFKVKVNGVEYIPTIASPNKKHARAQSATVCLQSLGLLPNT